MSFLNLKGTILAITVFLSTFTAPVASLALPDLVARDVDPFYTPPSGFENSSPGAILKSRTITSPPYIAYASANLKTTYQYLVRSSDQDGKAIAVATTLFVPQTGRSDRLLAHLLAYDSSYNPCSPSYGFVNNTVQSPDGVAIAFALSKGWYVVAPDYEGTAAGFGNGPLSGKGTLDSIRAVLGTSSTSGISRSALVALEGASGGAIAGEYAAELISSYSSDLGFNIVAAALGALTPSLLNVYNKVNGGFAAGLAVTAINGLSNSVTDFNNYLAYGLVPSTAANFRKANTQCAQDNLNTYFGQDINLYFNEGSSWVNDQIPQNTLMKVGTMGRISTPGIPLYFYKGAKDELSNQLDTDFLYNLYCGNNVNSLTYNISTASAHIESAIYGYPEAIKFIEDRFDGVPAPKGCTKVTNNKNAFDAYDATIVAQTYLDALQKAVITGF